ncbi:MAG: hypothetical protein ACKPKO_16880, partial [Candidatus Fonsibacter sp.]
PQIARGQCRSLSEEPNRISGKDLPTAVSAPRFFRPGDLQDDVDDPEERKEAAPITHALFIRDKEELPSAPFPMKEKIDPSDLGYKKFTTAGRAIKRSKSLKPQWRRRRLISRIMFGRKIAKVVRLSDPQVGFGGRNHLQSETRTRQTRVERPIPQWFLLRHRVGRLHPRMKPFRRK